MNAAGLRRRLARVALLTGVVLLLATLTGKAAGVEELIRENQTGTMHEKEGEVAFRHGSLAEVPAYVPQFLSFGDSLRTTNLARASGFFADWTQFRLKPMSILRIEPRDGDTNQPMLRLTRGEIYIS